MARMFVDRMERMVVASMVVARMVVESMEHTLVESMEHTLAESRESRFVCFLYHLKLLF
jgi:hypothetical protein